MTVSYQSDVASSTSGGLFRLLWRWRGSVWKLVYRELALFLICFISLAFSYDFLLPESGRRVYEKIVIFCSAFVDMIPLSFILGFYVSFTANRWWNQYIAIPWPDKIMLDLNMYMPGTDETSRMIRRTLMRYLNLSLVLVLRSISIAVKRRFPTKEHLIEAGFMTKPELDMFSAVPATEFNTFWIPCTWFVNLLRESRQECRITDSSGLKLIMEELNEFREKCGLLWSYDWVSIPLVYTQVVTISTYAFFIASVFGRQHVNPPEYPQDVFLTEIEHRGEYYIPVFSILQFLLYMGLLKLGEQLINPFGDDDEDFELNWIIDRHIKVSFLGVDELSHNPPPLIKDNYFDLSEIKVPYTAAAVTYKKKTYRGSMATYHIISINGQPYISTSPLSNLTSVLGPNGSNGPTRPTLLSRVPSEQQGYVVPHFEEEEDDDDPQPNYLGVPDKVWRDSVWSVIGGKLSSKYGGSIGNIVGDPELGSLGTAAAAVAANRRGANEEYNNGDDADTWQGSCLSFVTGQEEQSAALNDATAEARANPATSGPKGAQALKSAMTPPAPIAKVDSIESSSRASSDYEAPNASVTIRPGHPFQIVTDTRVQMEEPEVDYDSPPSPPTRTSHVRHATVIDRRRSGPSQVPIERHKQHQQSRKKRTTYAVCHQVPEESSKGPEQSKDPSV